MGELASLKPGSTVAGVNTAKAALTNCADTLDFHRNYMETTTVSVAANNSDAWSALRTLIYPAGGSELAAIPVADALPVDQLRPTPAAAAPCVWFTEPMLTPVFCIKSMLIVGLCGLRQAAWAGRRGAARAACGWCVPLRSAWSGGSLLRAPQLAGP
jgi:hypothetical protein